jgi:hypothetical protein
VTASPGHIVKKGDGNVMLFSTAGKYQRGTHRTNSIAGTKDRNDPWAIDPQLIVPSEEQNESS